MWFIVFTHSLTLWLCPTKSLKKPTANCWCDNETSWMHWRNQQPAADVTMKLPERIEETNSQLLMWQWNFLNVTLLQIVHLFTGCFILVTCSHISAPFNVICVNGSVLHQHTHGKMMKLGHLRFCQFSVTLFCRNLCLFSFLLF